MHNKTRQRGITLIGFIIVLALLGFFGVVAAKLFPMYSEFFAVKAAMRQIQNTPGAATMSPDQIWRSLDKIFYTSYVESVGRGDITVDRKGGNYLRIAYEVRKPLFYNLEIVAMFDHSVELGGGTAR